MAHQNRRCERSAGLIAAITLDTKELWRTDAIRDRILTQIRASRILLDGGQAPLDARHSAKIPSWPMKSRWWLSIPRFRTMRSGDGGTRRTHRCLTIWWRPLPGSAWGQPSMMTSTLYPDRPIGSLPCSSCAVLRPGYVVPRLDDELISEILAAYQGRDADALGTQRAGLAEVAAFLAAHRGAGVLTDGAWSE